jgi:hypothetical protein
MLMSHHQNAGQNHNIKIANRSFGNLVKFRYLGTVTNRNLIHEESKSRLNSDNACYQSVQNLLSSRLLSKNIKIKIYNTILLPVVLYWCETWSLILREEHKLRVYENRVLRRVFGIMRIKWYEVGGNCVMRSFITCTICKIYFHDLVTRHGVWIGNWIYWTPVNYNYK